MDLVEKYLGEANVLQTIHSIGKMPGKWGERLGSFGTVLAKALKDAKIEVIGIKPIGKFDNEITVSYKNKKKNIKITGNSSAEKIVKKIIGEAKTTPDKHQEKICRDTVKNPSKGMFLGGPSAEEAEKILRTKFKYSDAQIKKLKK